MGSISSKNTVDSLIKDSVSTIESFTAVCSDDIANSQTITLENCPGFSVGDIANSQKVAINKKCMINATLQSRTQSSLDQQMKQSAEAINEGFGLSGVQAENVINYSIQIGRSLIRSYTTKCVNNFSNSQNISCNNSPNVTFGNVTNEQAVQSLSDCAINDTTVQDYANRIQTILDQTSKASSVNFGLLGIFIIFIIVLIVILVL